MIKTFVLDTNVLLHNAECIESFADNVVVLPMAVIEELDRFKKDNNELGRNARRVIRKLDSMRVAGNLRDGVPLGNEGMLKIICGKTTIDETGLDSGITDNRILRVAYNLHKEGKRVVFVSKDINARLKADALGLQVMDFEKQKINFDELYPGYSEVTLSPEDMAVLRDTRTLDVADSGNQPNELILVRAEGEEGKPFLGRVVEGGKVKPVSDRYDTVWNIRARNVQQRMAMELLMDPAVQIVTLVGQAGTGKTLIALAAGLHAVLREKRYDRILVSRPIIPMGQDIGYLPGAKEEKLSHWMQPIFDNLTFLLRDGLDRAQKKKKTRISAQEKTDKLLRDNVIAIEALTYIRGRSIPGQYVVIDEAQNLTPHEVKTIVSRSGEGTKMVLTGDPYQIDNPYLDASSNGLTYTAERLKGQALHGHITLATSERSALAAIAAENL